MERSPRELSDGEPRVQNADEPREKPGVDDPGRAQGLSSATPTQRRTLNGTITHADADEPLLTQDSSSDFERRWEQVQVTFVDDPRQAVREAEALVGEVVDELTQMFTKQRADLERTWSRGEDVSTEDLRVGLQRYRSFFRRLLAT